MEFGVSGIFFLVLFCLIVLCADCHGCIGSLDSQFLLVDFNNNNNNNNILIKDQNEVQSAV